MDNHKLCVGVVGLGFVGDAIWQSLTLKQKELNLSIKLVGFDKYKYGGIGKIDDILLTDFCFLCLPTLFDKDKGKYDKSAINEVCKYLDDQKYTGLVIIKSTVEPGTCQNLANKYTSLHIIHNPEFLTARTAAEDFHNQKHIVLGNTKSDETDVEKVCQFYKQLYPDAEISTCNSNESESMKIFVNSFYAMKVQIFNEFYLLCQKTNADYDKITELMLKNGWISPHHINVPGPDGKLSYGGACFPKDTQALLNHMKRLETPHAVLDACVAERNYMRDD